MNYERHYSLLIAKAVTEQRGTKCKPTHGLGYVEQHHIVPKCLGGSEESSNLVLLTAREHFVAHRLLAKAYPDHLGLLQAVASFQGSRQNRMLTSRQIATARQVNAIAISLRNSLLAVKGKLFMQTEEGKSFFRELAYARAAAGQMYTQTKEGRLANKLRMQSLSAQGKLWSQTEEGRQHLAERNKEVYICPHCSKQGSRGPMQRWHGRYCLCISSRRRMLYVAASRASRSLTSVWPEHWSWKPLVAALADCGITATKSDCLAKLRAL